MNIRTVLCALSLVVGVTSSGGTYEFQNKSKAVHYWDNPAEWKLSTTSGVIPQAGNQVQMDAFGADSTMYLTNDLSTSFSQIRMKGGIRATSAVPTGSFRFLGEGVEFALPVAESNYDLCPAKFQSYNCGVTCDLVVLSNAVSRKAAQLSMSNFDLLSGNREDGSSYFQFNAGSFNFHDPDGTDNGSMLIFGSPACGTAEIDFAPGTVLRAGDGILQSPSGTAVDLGFNQAEAVFAGKFTVKGGALSIRGGSFSSESYSQSDGDSIVGDDAQFTVATSAGSTISGGIFMMTNEAVASVAGDMAVNGASNPRLEVAGGDLTVKGKLDLGSNNNGTLAISGGKFTLTANGDSLRVGAGGGSGLIEISGGTTTVARIRLARSTGDGSTRLVQTGGLLRSHFGNYGGIEFLQSCKAIRGGTHVVELNGGVSELRFIKCSVDLAYGTRCLYADGGTLRPTEDCETEFITGLTETGIGEKGLVLDTLAYNVGIEQDFTNKGDAEGLLRKCGSGCLTYAGAYSVSQTSVEAGELRVVGADSTFRTSLSVAPGATFSLVGSSTGITLDALTVERATLALDPGDVVAVNGPVDVSRLRIWWSSVPEEPAGFLVLDGELSDETRAAIANAVFSNVLPEGKHASFGFGFDAQTGRTTVTATMADDKPLSSVKTWTGAGAWTTAANWSTTVLPTAEDKAAFTEATAGKTVEVTAGAMAGALVFGDDGYVLSGEGPLALAGEQGSAQIEVTAGSHRIGTPISLSAAVPVSVAAGTALEISGEVSRGGLAKSGTGRLTLSAPASYEKSVTSADGLLTVRDAAALGASPDDSVLLGGGTIEFNAADGQEMHFRPSFALDAPATNGLIVFKTDTDVVLDSLNVKCGAFAKRGAGTLTVNVSAAAQPPLLSGLMGTTSNPTKTYVEPGLVFPPDGTAPSPDGTKYPAFSISEGGMVLKGVGTGARARMEGFVIVGMCAHECAVQPFLTVDGLELDATSGDNFFVGHDMGDRGVAVNTSTLRILNGAAVRIAKTQIGYGSGIDGMKSVIVATNGTFQIAQSGSHITRIYGDNTAVAVYRFKDSSLLVGDTYKIGGGIDLDFDNSVLSGMDGETVSCQAETWRPRGTMLFRNGSVFASTAIAEDQGNPLHRDIVFAFDNAEWQCHGSHGNYTVPASLSGKVRYEMRGIGVILAPDEGKTYTVNAPFEGAGGLVKRGEGTVKFGPGAYAFSGVCRVESGTVDLSDAGTLDAPCISGTGRVVGATAAGARFVVDLSDDWQISAGGVPELSGCSFSGSVKIDAGRTEANPLALPKTPLRVAIGRVSDGTVLDVSRWKLVNTGNRAVRGEFSVEDGIVYLTPCPPKGLLLIVN